MSGQAATTPGGRKTGRATVSRKPSRPRGPAGRLRLRELPWLELLPPEERAEFLSQADTLVQAGEITALAQLIVEWKATAEIYAEPELLAELTAPAVDVELDK